MNSVPTTTCLRPSTSWHKTSYDHFLHHGLPNLLSARLGINDYRVEAEAEHTCCIHIEVGGNSSVHVEYPTIPTADEEGVFRIDHIDAGAYPAAWTPDLPVQRYSHPHDLVVLPIADRDDLDQARIQCVGDQLCAFAEARLGQLPPEVELDADLVRSLAPLDNWIRAFFTHAAQRLNGNNWLDRSSHLRRVVIPDRE
ncbi:MAG: hypothetical protein HOH74_30405, partial [Gemmatimonadetes bacterium]|nr:hypothetical protein [Gemmatimonadota bacterium]